MKKYDKNTVRPVDIFHHGAYPKDNNKSKERDQKQISPGKESCRLVRGSAGIGFSSPGSYDLNAYRK